MDNFSDLRVLIIDSHPITLKVILESIEALPNIRVVGHSGSGDEAIDLVRMLMPDIVLIDLRLHTMSGIRVSQHILAEFPSTCVFCMSAHIDEYGFDSIENTGAIKIIPKEKIIDALVEYLEEQSAKANKGFTNQGGC